MKLRAWLGLVAAASYVSEDANRTSLSEAQEKPDAGFVDTIAMLKGDIAHMQSFVEIAHNALVDIRATIGGVSDGSPGAVSEHRDFASIRIDREGLRRIREADIKLRESLDQARLWDARAERASQKASALMRVHKAHEQAAVAKCLVTYLPLVKQLTQLTRAAKEAEAHYRPVLDNEQQVDAEYKNVRLRNITRHSSGTPSP